jgi:DNA-binding transcriptional regulator PaaX
MSFSENILIAINDFIEKFGKPISVAEALNPGLYSMRKSHQKEHEMEHERIIEEREREKKKRKLYSTLYYLKRNQFIEEITGKKDKQYRLTSKGILKIFNIKIKSASNPKKKLENNQNLLVIFDIPETKRRDRDFFRRGLMLLGFERKQLSVWISPYNSIKEVKEWVRICGIEDYVEYFFVKEI